MKTCVNLYAGLFAVAILAAGCGPNTTAVPPGPTGPSTLAPLFLPQLDGVWGGEMQLTGIAGGTGPARSAGAIACVGAAFDNVVGETLVNSLAIKQTGTDLTAKLTSAATGLSCTYTGRVSASGSVVLSASTCDTVALVLRCPTGEVLSLTLVGSTITAATDAPVSVTSLTGVAAHTYNVAGQSGLVANHVLGLTRR